MKRRTFIQRGSIGLGAILAGGGGAGRLLDRPGEKRRIYGIPDSVKLRSPLTHNLARYSLAQTDLPPEAWQDVVALGLLAQDVFENPKVAEAFSRNPGGYLKAIGMTDVALDPATAEVQVALALGDPQIREAVERQDPKAFLEVIERRGLLRRPETSQLVSKLTDQVANLQTQMGPGFTPEACSVFAVCILVLAVWIYVAAVQDVVVSVAALAVVSLYVYALAWTGVGGPRRKLTVWQGGGGVPSLRLATVMGGEIFAGEVADTFIEEHVERVAEAIEGLQFFRDNSTMEPSRLRDAVRVQLMRQMSGHAVIEDGPAR